MPLATRWPGDTPKPRAQRRPYAARAGARGQEPGRARPRERDDTLPRPYFAQVLGEGTGDGRSPKRPAAFLAAATKGYISRGDARQYFACLFRRRHASFMRECPRARRAVHVSHDIGMAAVAAREAITSFGIADIIYSTTTGFPS